MEFDFELIRIILIFVCIGIILFRLFVIFMSSSNFNAIIKVITRWSILCIILCIVFFAINYNNKKAEEILQSPERQELIEKIKEKTSNPFIMDLIYAECHEMRKYPYYYYNDKQSCILGETGAAKLAEYCAKEQKENRLFNDFYDKCIDFRGQELK